MLDIAAGTGLPFAKHFVSQGHHVHACDLADVLVRAFRINVPNAEIRTESSHDLSFVSSFFDVTYCFHSTWYFEYFQKSILEMIRVTKEKGLIYFDVQNKLNDEIKKSFEFHKSQNQGWGLLRRYYYNVLMTLKKQGKPSWAKVVYETPTDPIELLSYLMSMGQQDINIYFRTESHELIKADKRSLSLYPRLVFEIKVTQKKS